MEKKQTAVEFYRTELSALVSMKESKFQNENEIFEQAKKMEREQMIDAIKIEIKLIGNYFDVGKLEQREQGHHIRFTSILKDRFDHYNKTFENNK
jgi:hypothetical protein